MTLSRKREYPTKQQFESTDDYAKRLRDAIQEEATDRIQDFDIWKLSNTSFLEIPWTDIRAYGATGDGSTDDTDAFNDATTATSKPLLVAPGKYKITSDITCVGLCGIQGTTTHLELNDSAKIIISGGTDSWATPLKNLKIELLSDNATGVDIRRRRVHVDGVYMLGNGKANGQKGFFFNLDESVSTFNYFENFFIYDLGYPIYIDMTSAEGNHFSGNRIGSLGGAYFGGFADAITFDTGDDGVAHSNEFGGYFEGGTGACIVFKKNNVDNVFNMVKDTDTTNLISVDTGVTVTGNIYNLPDDTDYITTGSGTTYKDIIYSKNAIFANRRVDYIMEAKDTTGWYGLAADSNNNTALELVGDGFNGAAQTDNFGSEVVRAAGYLPLKYKSALSFYNSTNDMVIGKFIGQKFWSRHGFLTKEDTNFNIAVPDTVYLVDTGDVNRTATLPVPANARGVVFVLKKIDAGTGDVVITQNDADTIDGAATVSIATQYESVRLMSDGTNWHRLDIEV